MWDVLVTGGAGYIGGHVCKALAEAGYRPISIDNLCLGHRKFVKWGPLIEADVRDTDVIAAVIRSHNLIGVIHLAAFASVDESMRDPAIYYDNNVRGTLSLLEAMRKTKFLKLVFSSSCAVYGSPNTTAPISELTATDPISPYGRSKLMCERIISDYASAYGFKSIALRYFNASGADPEAGIGEKRQVETHLIPRAMMALQGYIQDFHVNGADFATHDGTAVRDYIHVRDLAQAHILALHHLSGGGCGGTFNLGVGKGYSVKEVLNAISAVAGRTINAPSGARRSGDPAELVADGSQAQKILGFTPRFSDLQTIVESAWRWHSAVHPRLTSADWRISRIG
jgi:UDP-arabinose 4-epimerase